MKRSMKPIRAVLPALLICLLCSQTLASTFSETYATYQGAMQSKDWPLALSSAKQAVEEGIRSFDPGGENVANLRLNYARELLRDGQNELAANQLKLCLKAKVASHGQASPALIDVILELARSMIQTDVKQAKKYYKRVLKLVSAEGNDLLEAKIKLDAGLKLSKVGENKAAKKYLIDAQAFYSLRFGNSDLRAGMAALNLGQIQFSNKDYKQARLTLNSALEAFTASDPTAKKFNLAVRMLLVQILETLKMRDEATGHVIALAINEAINGSAEPTILFKGSFYSPAGIQRNSNGIERMGGGLSRVTLVHDVDEYGFVVNASIVSSPSRAMSSAAIKSAGSRRYSPRIEDGEPVMTRGLEYHYWVNSTVEIF